MLVLVGVWVVSGVGVAVSVGVEVLVGVGVQVGEGVTVGAASRFTRQVSTNRLDRTSMRGMDDLRRMGGRCPIV